MEGTLRVTVVRGTNLPKSDISGKSDPYVQLSVGNQIHRTQVKKKTLNPEWNETFDFTIGNSSSERLRVQCLDEDMLRNQSMGEGYVSLDGLSNGGAREETVRLNGDGRLLLLLQASFAPARATSPPRGPQTLMNPYNSNSPPPYNSPPPGQRPPPPYSPTSMFPPSPYPGPAPTLSPYPGPASGRPYSSPPVPPWMNSRLQPPTPPYYDRPMSPPRMGPYPSISPYFPSFSSNISPPYSSPYSQRPTPPPPPPPPPPPQPPPPPPPPPQQPSPPPSPPPNYPYIDPIALAAAISARDDYMRSPRRSNSPTPPAASLYCIPCPYHFGSSNSPSSPRRRRPYSPPPPPPPPRPRYYSPPDDYDYDYDYPRHRYSRYRSPDYDLEDRIMMIEDEREELLQRLDMLDEEEAIFEEYQDHGTWMHPRPRWH